MKHEAPGSIGTAAPSSGLGPLRSGRWETGGAVRRDWPDGPHALVGFRASAEDAARFLRRDRQYWRRGPYRPRAWAVVVVSRRDFELHIERHECRAPD